MSKWKIPLFLAIILSLLLSCNSTKRNRPEHIYSQEEIDHMMFWLDSISLAIDLEKVCEEHDIDCPYERMDSIVMMLLNQTISEIDTKTRFIRYKVNGKYYNIPEYQMKDFEKDFPNAEIYYQTNKGTYAIPLDLRDDFLADVPYAKYYQPTITKRDNKEQNDPNIDTSDEDYHNYLAAGLLAAVPSGPKVYICTGPQSKRYHKTKDCKGLQSCSESIKKVSIEEAERIGRTPCGYCYKKK